MPELNEDAHKLAGRLRDLQIKAGFTAVELEAETGIGRAKVSRVINVRRLLSAREIRLWVHACGGSDAQADELVEMLANARAVDSTWTAEIKGGQDKVQQVYASLVNASSVIAYVEPFYIPGPLQTVAYATEILTRSENFWREGGADPKTVARAVMARTATGGHFHDPNKHFTLVTSEVAISTFRYIKPHEMLEQLDHLRAFVDRPSMWFGIIPPGYVAKDVVPHGFQIFDDQVRADTAGEVIRRSDKQRFEVYERRLESVKALAATGADATALIDAAVEKLL